MASSRSANGLDGLKPFLLAHADRDVLLSDEGLTGWLFSTEKQDAFVRWLAALREVTAVRCVWTVRRFDEVFSASYLVMLGFGFELPPPMEYLAEAHRPRSYGVRNPDEIFAGMSRVEEAVGGDVSCVRYEPGGGHAGELLRALRVPDRAAAEILGDLRSGRRLNSRLGHKQAATLLNLHALAARLGAELDGVALRGAFARGELVFDGDRPCQPLGCEARSALQRRALAAVERHGCPAYTEFFGDVEVDGPSFVSLGPDALDDDDLKRLAAFSTTHGRPS